MIPATSERVRHSTSASVNRRIEDHIRDSIAWHAGHPQRIGGRLKELDREWDTERALEANAAVIAFTGTLLAATHDKRWLAVPAIVTAFLFQHAVQGWCPPLPVLRRLGFRTAREIDAERTALKALRGDFDHSAKAKQKPEAILKASLH
jgi:uncharacterized protein YdaU (DUF1376 family)